MVEMYGTEAMGETAENIAEMTGITREEQDRFALRSHQRAIAAIDTGKFAEEIVPVPVPQKKGDPLLVTTDERPRRDTTLEALARLKPAFRKNGTVTAGNSSGLNDGAAALLLMSAEKAAAVGSETHGAHRRFRRGRRAAAHHGHGARPGGAQGAGAGRHTNLDQVGLVEINEAFAVQTLAVMRELGLSEEKTNVNGGAIALGHPLGCSGARILTTLLHEMKRRAAAGTASTEPSLRAGDVVRGRRAGGSYPGRVAANERPGDRLDRLYRLEPVPRAGRARPHGARLSPAYQPLRLLEAWKLNTRWAI